MVIMPTTQYASCPTHPQGGKGDRTHQKQLAAGREHFSKMCHISATKASLSSLGTSLCLCLNTQKHCTRLNAGQPSAHHYKTMAHLHNLSALSTCCRTQMPWSPGLKVIPVWVFTHLTPISQSKIEQNSKEMRPENTKVRNFQCITGGIFSV